jgi:hypothetical protein
LAWCNRWKPSSRLVSCRAKCIWLPIHSLSDHRCMGRPFAFLHTDTCRASFFPLCCCRRHNRIAGGVGAGNVGDLCVHWQVRSRPSITWALWSVLADADAWCWYRCQCRCCCCCCRCCSILVCVGCQDTTTRSIVCGCDELARSLVQPRTQGLGAAALITPLSEIKGTFKGRRSFGFQREKASVISVLSVLSVL